MQQRQLRLGDILDDYCPRERRLTNHAVVAMIGGEVKQTRCTTCDADHEYKHAKVPRPRKKGDEPAALYSQVLAGGPKRVTHEMPPRDAEPSAETAEAIATPESMSGEESASQMAASGPAEEGDATQDADAVLEEGPVHRPLIRATLPRHEGQVSPGRPAPDFTIRQPAGRQNRFRPRPQFGGQAPQGNRSGGSMGGPGRGASQRQHGGRPPQGSMTSRPSSRRHDAGRKRSK